jgi:type II secretory pathway pseudopilin PulG
LTANLARFRAELSASGQLGAIENGRLILLQQSVETNDWFFQALHQLFCLRSHDQSLLPRSVRNISPNGFIHLEKLLCANTTASPAFIKFAAEFPEPLMDLYSDPDIKYRDVYEGRLARVRLFIETLATRWDSFVNKHIKVFSPPLVQEMVEELHLNTSPVLQRVLFTAVARMFWQCGDCPALNALLNLHELDSRGYQARHLRTETEKLVAKSHMRLIYNEWNRRGLTDPQSRDGPYTAPPDIIHWFLSTIPQPVTGPLHTQQPLNVAPQQNLPRDAPSAQPTLRLPTSRQNSFADVSNSASPLSPSMVGIQQLGANGRPSVSRTASAQTRPIASPPTSNAVLQMQDQRPIQLQRHQQRQQQLLQQQEQQLLQAQQQHQQMQLHRQMQIAPSRPQVKTLYPPEGAGPASQPTHPDAVRSGLHQAHLRSPVLVPSLLPGEDDPEGKTKSQPLRLYLHVVGYGLPPTMLASHALQTISFRVSVEAFARLPKRDSLAPCSINLTTSTNLYRLRCCSATAGVGFPSENAWITTDTIWPPEITSIEFNGAIIETRNKLHYGKYLPVNVTDFMKEGNNVLVVGMDTDAIKRNGRQYAIALEAVSAKSHQDILNGLIRPTLQQSRDAIIGRSSSAAKDEDAEMKDSPAAADDELTITSTAQTISLLDPYTASRPIALPVRGKSCLHRDPFDLETFLSQLPPAQNPRLYPPFPTSGNESSNVTHADAWRCPRCRADVRPQTLIVDAFLVDVLAKLKDEGKLEGENSARAIQVQPDGSWEVKQEATSAGEMSGVEKTRTKKVIEIIELD